MSQPAFSDWTSCSLVCGVLLVGVSASARCSAEEGKLDSNFAVSKPGTTPLALKTAKINVLWKVPTPAPGAKARGIVVHPQPLSERQSKVEAALLATMTAKFPVLPLEDVVSRLNEELKIPIRLQARTLREAGIPKGTNVCFQCQGMKLSSGLNWMLSQVPGEPLATLVDESGLVITTETQASIPHETRIYDVRPLQFSDLPELVDILVETVPEDWTGAGDNGGMIQIWDQTLVVTHSQKVHREIQQILELMWQHLANCLTEQKKPQILVHRCSLLTWETNIEKVLEQSTQLELKEVSLEEAVSLIRERHRLPIFLDEKQLQVIGVEKNEKVTCQTGGDVSLRFALSQILEEVGGSSLTTTCRDERLIVTGHETSQATFETRIYDVRGLQTNNPEGLSFLLRAAVPGPWRELERGSGSLNLWAGSLIVRQTQQVHRDTLIFLEQLLAATALK